MTLFFFTTDQVGVSLICVNFCRSNAPFGFRIKESRLFSLLSFHISECKLVASFEFNSYISTSLLARSNNFFNQLQIWICWSRWGTCIASAILSVCLFFFVPLWCLVFDNVMFWCCTVLDLVISTYFNHVNGAKCLIHINLCTESDLFPFLFSCI